MTIRNAEERTTLITQAQERRLAHDLLEQTGGHVENLTVEGGSSAAAVPPELVDIISQVLQVMANGGTVLIGSLPEELTTTVAAEQLGLSRPTLMKMIRDGEIPSHKVGTHHRLKASDVLEFKRARLRRQRAALEELRALEDELASL